jgi:2-dehydro-3-deoxyphosphogluconate aldolase / (4S)-4-hydroxy-2-oxoglutarate aldolase
MAMTIEQVMWATPVIPAIIIDDVVHALPLAEALVAGGLNVLEVTLRTPAALDALRAMNEVEGAVVGAGTVLNPRDYDAAMRAGAQFIVSPGLTEPLAEAIKADGTPFLPGVATSGEIMRALDHGFAHLKFFPAMASGGVPALKAIAAAFGQCRFCPTGGITQDNAGEWLALDQVLCVGGSWVAPRGEPDTGAITAMAHKAMALAR